jgi:LysR family transcriptional regulator for bpeEF and oprC
MDQLKAMQIFRAVADCKSFTQAAEQLGLPKPTVTNAVQSIELQLGVRLLQRTTRKVSLTVEGALYLERCQRLLGDLDDLNALFMVDGRKPGGVVRAEFPERLAQMVVIPALPEFFALYPDIQVKLGANDRFADLAGEGIDVAVRGGTLRDSSLVARRIGDMVQINAASTVYLDAHGRPRTPDDLARHYAVNFFSTQSGRDMDWEYRDAACVTRTVAMRSWVSVTSSGAYLQSCCAGLGLVQGPAIGMLPLIASGELEEVLPDWRPAPMPLQIVTTHHRHTSPRVRVFVDWLSALLARRLVSE